uniref:Uncharacterized protein n=1 Tax=Avena sativa TaxID=4498 RepID=A0ACD5WCH6_AVESA
MEANGGGHALDNGGGHGNGLANGAGGHGLANGAGHADGMANGVGGHGLAEHALANGAGQANGLANGAGGQGQAEHVLANGAGHANGAGGHGQAEHALANGAGHDLPNGVVPAQAAAVNPGALYQVFLHLPAQEIARCRGVCRLWRDITGTEAFRHDHHHHRYRTPMPLVFPRAPGLARINAVDFRYRMTRPVIRFPLHQEALRIHGSCSGILLLSYGDRLYACNPCTRRWANLPPLHVDNHIIGFYLAGVYQGFAFQVLYHNRREPNCEYRIFELGAEAPEPPTWSIGRPALVQDVHLDLVLANGIAPSYTVPPVYVHLSPALVFLFWLPQATWSNSDILVFDTAAQSFGLIPPPTIQVDGGADIPVGVGGQLLEIGKHLAMTIISPARVEVWVRSNINHLWSRRYHRDVPTRVMFAAARERNGPVHSPHISLSGNQIVHSRHTIEESLLLRPDILPMQDTDAVDGDPPFFRNH